MGTFSFNGTSFAPLTSGEGIRWTDTGKTSGKDIRCHINFDNDSNIVSLEELRLVYDNEGEDVIWYPQTYIYINNPNNERVTIREGENQIYPSTGSYSTVSQYTLFSGKGHDYIVHLESRNWDILYPYSTSYTNSSFSSNWHYLSSYTMDHLETSTNTDKDSTINTTITKIPRGSLEDMSSNTAVHCEMKDGKLMLCQWWQYWPASLSNTWCNILAVWAPEYRTNYPCSCLGPDGEGTPWGVWDCTGYSYGCTFANQGYGRIKFNTPDTRYDLVIIYEKGAGWKYCKVRWNGSQYIDVTSTAVGDKKELENPDLSLAAAEKEEELKDNTESH